MTNAHLGRDPSRMFAGFMQSLRGGASLFAKVGFGALIFVAAGVVAVATAIAGVLLALAALILKAGFGRRPAMARARANPTPDGVLEARRTARGWTVDR